MKLATYILAVLFFGWSSPEKVDAPCAYLFDGIDMDAKLHKKEMYPSRWWSYTPPEVKNTLQEEDLIKTSLQLIKVENKTYLNLNLELYSATAAKQYGAIDKGTQLIIKTINGREYKLQCRAGSGGKYISDTKRYLYAVSYPLTKKDIRGLSKSPIDRVGVQWASGYEEYTVYEVALLQNQLQCLNQ